MRQPTTMQAEQARESPPLGEDELRRLVGPHRVVDLVLARRDRLAASLARGPRLAALTLVLLLTSVLAALPFGLVLGGGPWRVALLLVGSLVVCFPSLHVFGALLGSRLSLAQTLALALVITCVAALFTLALSPILWFLEVTMPARATLVGPGQIAVGLLVCSLLAGVFHLMRVLRADAGLQRLAASSLVILALWLHLFVFVTYRMGLFLGLV
jgi:hypothetical protein